MKNLKKIVTLVGITVLFFSCTTDNESIPDVNADAKNLIGSWLLIEITQDGTVEAEIEGVPVSGTITSFGKDIDVQITFSESPNNYTASGSYTDVITIKVLGQTFNEEQNISVDDLLGQGSWALDQGILTLTQSSNVREATITELTTSSLKLDLKIEEEVILQDITGTIKSTISMTLSK